jgi:hypothetical protein
MKRDKDQKSQNKYREQIDAMRVIKEAISIAKPQKK